MNRLCNPLGETVERVLLQASTIWQMSNKIKGKHPPTHFVDAIRLSINQTKISSQNIYQEQVFPWVLKDLLDKQVYFKKSNKKHILKENFKVKYYNQYAIHCYAA